VGVARYVCIGEASHGAHEYYLSAGSRRTTSPNVGVGLGDLLAL
jgi:hypothetical protein